jgi:hypothetical protein
MLAREDIRDLYRRRAGWYDLSALDDMYFGFAYVASGTVRGRNDSIRCGPGAATIHTTTGALL